MDVHLRSAIHPLLGRLRIGAPRLWPLSPELHTSDCSFACPGSSTWVDKVPSRDTPSLNLAGCRGGVNLDNPQVARNQSSIGGAVTPASARMRRSPGQPSMKAVSAVSPVLPTGVEGAADQRPNVCVGLRDGAENLSSAGRCFDIADPDLEVPLAVPAAADLSLIHI